MMSGLAESAIEHARRAGMLCQIRRFRDSFPHFASAEAHLEALAAAGGRLPSGLDELPRHVQDAWLQAIVALGDEEFLDEETILSAIVRCDRLLALTVPPVGDDAIEAREYALYN